MSAESDLLKRLEKVVGYVPVGTSDLLHILTHPDVLQFTTRYIEESN